MKGLDVHLETQLMQHQRKIDNMKTFIVTASYITYCTAEIEAESQEEAYEIARSMDGGDFDVNRDTGLSDWEIEEVREVTP